MDAANHFVDLVDAKLNQYIVSPRGVKVQGNCSAMLMGNKLLKEPIEHLVLVAELVALDIKKNCKREIEWANDRNVRCIINAKTFFFTIGNVVWELEKETKCKLNSLREELVKKEAHLEQLRQSLAVRRGKVSQMEARQTAHQNNLDLKSREQCTRDKEQIERCMHMNEREENLNKRERALSERERVLEIREGEIYQKNFRLAMLWDELMVKDRQLTLIKAQCKYSLQLTKN
jgi:hypothetical protein